MKAFNRNFILMIIGQIISLFGNAILRFSLSLYVLQVTSSASIFATILAVSILPTILLSPFGGILADRVSRRSIMLNLDFLTSFLIFGFSMVSTRGFSIVLVAILMISLSIIQAFYQPSVQASIPLLVSENQLMQANGIVVQINALATLLGPILGGFLFSFLPFSLLLNISGTAFFLSAILECIMRIPFQRVATDGSMLSIIRSDCRQSLHFLRHDNPTLLHLLLLLAGLNLVLSSFITVGLPVISNITLQLPPTFYGWLEAATGIGSIAGSIALPFFLKRVDMSGAWRFLLSGSLFLLPMALVLFLHTPVYICLHLCIQHLHHAVCGLIQYLRADLPAEIHTESSAGKGGIHGHHGRHVLLPDRSVPVRHSAGDLCDKSGSSDPICLHCLPYHFPPQQKCIKNDWK